MSCFWKDVVGATQVECAPPGLDVGVPVDVPGAGGIYSFTPEVTATYGVSLEITSGDFDLYLRDPDNNTLFYFIAGDPPEFAALEAGLTYTVDIQPFPEGTTFEGGVLTILSEP